MTILVLGAMLLSATAALAQPPTPAPVLELTQTVSQEPLLGGNVVFVLKVTNKGAVPVQDKGYNLTITDTLPAGLTYVGADVTPTSVAVQADGTTLLAWENMADLEVTESFQVAVTAALKSNLLPGSQFVNLAAARVNAAPDNSLVWVQSSAQLNGTPQPIDIDLDVIQSTGEEQASGAGEYPSAPGRQPGADWVYQYRATVRNNNVGPSQNVVAKVILPAGVAYLGSPAFSSNPNSVSTTPSLKLKNDGSLELSWALGNFTTAQYATPVVITFNTAIPYRFRTVADQAAKNGPFAGPMAGDVIGEDTVLAAEYEATATYNNAPASDGSTVTPADDSPARVTAEYFTLRKTANPTTVGIGTEVTFALTFYASEYYTITGATLTDVLPDGMTYVAESANLTPREVLTDTPGAGQTTITWDLPAAMTTPGAANQVTFRAVVDPTYAAAPLAGLPIVSGDSLTNRVTANGQWQDAVDPARMGTLTPDDSSATVRTAMPTFDKVVRHPVNGQWVRTVDAYVGDTLTFRLTYASAANIDAKDIVIRDFLPRGMTYVAGSATHTVNGDFTNGATCTAAPQAPTFGQLNGLDFLEWKLCNAARGATWEVTLQARVGPVPNVQPGWIVANFGKLSGQNTAGQGYSLRALANTNYKAPKLVMRKSSTPSNNIDADGRTVVNYTLRVTNDGTAPAYNLVARDTVPVSLTIQLSGGSSSPAGNTYTTISGRPDLNQGGVLQWSTVISLTPGASYTYRYTATVPSNAGLTAGDSLLNIASVAYNSRADNQGHAVNFSSNIDDDQTDDATIYIRGMTASKTANRSFAGIGDTVRWTVVITVPPGVNAVSPYIEEMLPAGFDFVTGSTVINGATLDENFTPNPYDSNDRIVRWYLNTIDNGANLNNYVFTLRFDALLTGVRSKDTATQYYLNPCCEENAENTVRAIWYSAGNVRRYSAHGRQTTIVRQPYLTLQKAASQSLVGAGDVVSYTLTVRNVGTNNGYDIALRDVIPQHLGFLGIDEVRIINPYPENPITVSGDNAPGSTTLNFAIDRLFVGATVTIIYRVLVDPAISVDLTLTNTASVPTYSSQPGAAPDNNGDRLPDERIYSGPTASVSLRTPEGGIAKSVTAHELTYGSQLVYTLTVPAQPVAATMYNVVVTDVIDSAFQVLGVTNGVASGNAISAQFASIPAGTQQEIAVTVQLPAGSPVTPGTLLRNQAFVRYDNSGGVEASNGVANTVVAPALTLEKRTEVIDVTADMVFSYTVTVRNVGNGTANNLRLVDTLPANLAFAPGATLLNGVAFADPVDGVWNLPPLAGQGSHELVFFARVLSAEAGVTYINYATVTGVDSLGQPIPADQSARFVADTDPDDSASVRIFGPLTWTTENTFVAFEDLKNVGWSDWDYNDFIVALDVRKGATPNGELLVVELHYEARAHGGAYNHRFQHQLPVYAGGDYWLTVYNAQGVLNTHTAGAFTGDEPTFTIFERTKTAMPLPVNPPFNLIKYPFSNTMQEQVGTIVGHRATLRVYLNDGAANTVDVLPPLPWDPFLFVYNTNQEVHLVQPGHVDNTQVVNNAFDPGNPMLGFDLPLAHVFNARWYWPQEFMGIWRVYPDYVGYATTSGAVNGSWWDAAIAAVNLDLAWHATPTARTVRQGEMIWAEETTSRYFAAPLVADLDNDGSQEVIIGNLVQWHLEVYDAYGKLRTGWPRSLQAEVKAGAAVGDLDGDGSLEVLVGDTRGYLHAFRHNGEPVAGWPIKVGPADQTYRILARPVVADLNGDTQPEVILALSDGKLYVYDRSGVLLAGWPVSLGDVADAYGSQVINSAPVVADLTGDGQLEIVVGSYDKRIYAYHADGALAWSFLTGDVIMGTPAVGDLDPAQPGLETVIGSGDRFLYVLSAAGAQLWRRPTGWTVRSSPLLVDLDGDGDLEIVLGSDDDKVYAWQQDGARVDGWPQQTGADVFASPAYGDATGDGMGEVVVAADDMQVHVWNAAGAAAEGWPQDVGQPVKGAPAVANLDTDPAAEIVVAGFDGALRFFGVEPKVTFGVFLPLVNR